LRLVGIVCALPAEARHLGPASRQQAPISTLSDGTLLAVSGMGCAAAARGARALLDAGATALASWGLAGGLDPALAAGAIFLPSEIVGLDGISVMTTPHWRERLSAAVSAHHPVARGKLLTSTRAIASVADKAALFAQTGAAAVDMESLAVAQAAQARELPFIAVRVIIDGACDALPAAVAAAADHAGHLRLWRLIFALTRSPAELAPLIRLARRYRAASRSLAALARVGSLAPHAFAGAPDVSP
jgi:adenosylhomocysteine nucleosidase